MSRLAKLSLRRERLCALSPAVLPQIAGGIAPGDAGSPRCHQTLLCPPTFTRETLR